MFLYKVYAAELEYAAFVLIILGCLPSDHNQRKIQLQKISKCLCIIELSFQEGLLFSKTADFTYNERFVENFKFTIFKNANGVIMHNASGTLLVDLKKVLVSFVIKVKSSEIRKDYDQVLFQGNADTCKISQGVIGNFLIKAILSYDRDTNYYFDCPMKKGFYYLNNLPNLDTSFIPPFIPRKDREWEMTIGAKTKFPKVATASQLVFVKIYGESKFN